MADDPFKYGLLAALAIALLIAAFTDIRERRIANWLNLAIAAGAPLFWIASGLSLWPGVAIQFGFAIAVFAVLSVLFAMRVMGGGDVKLLTALALWIDPANFGRLVVMMALVGGVLTIAVWGWHAFRRNQHKPKIPYGVAIAAAGLWIISTVYMPATATPIAATAIAVSAGQ